MPVFDNLNMTTSGGVAPGIADYYERKLLENAKPEMVHARDAQKRPLPQNNGKHVQFRRMTPFEATTEPLKEGVTPKGQEIRQTAFTAMVKPYGRHVEITDELNMYHLDNLHRETAKLLADQAALSLDTICRDAMCAGLNVQYAGSNTSRATITAEDKLAAADVKKAVRTLKRNNARPFPDGFYHAIVHPDAVFDLTADPQWIDVAKYQDKSKIERYELGCLYKVKFFESTNAKVFRPESVLYGNVNTLTLAAFDAERRQMTVNEAITDDDARALTGKLVNVQYAKSGMTVATSMCVERVHAGDKKITFRWIPDRAVTEEWTAGNACQIVPAGGGADGAPVYGTLIYGENAFGNVELGGTGKNVKVIINPPGSAGAADPLEQRGSIAWKVQGFTCVILQDAFVVRVEHGATA